MSPERAREVLLLYRPGTADAEDPEIVEAMEVARTNPALAAWWKEHVHFQAAIRAKLRAIEVPVHLKAALMARQDVKVVHVRPWWQQPAQFGAGAAVLILVLIALAAIWFRPQTPAHFAGFQERMLSTALREYRMDIVTNDMRQVRQYLASHGSPDDYEITAGLGRLALTGGGVLNWRSHPVSMVCFNRGDDQMLFLFVIDRSYLQDPPPETPLAGAAHQMTTISWSRGDKTYLLAGPEEKDFLQKYFGGRS